MENNFLAVNKGYLGLGLKSIDLLIVSQIDEFKRNGCECYVTNEQFSDMFGESVSTIKRALDRLEELNILKRDTTVVSGFGRANKQRVLSINNLNKWKVQNEPSINTMEGSNVDNGRFKNDEWKVHNDPIKDNLKDNLKENLSIEERVFNSEEEELSKLKRELEDFTTERLKELLRRFELGKTDTKNHGYKILKKDFGIESKLDKNLGKIIKDILERRDYINRQLEAMKYNPIPEYSHTPAEYKKKTKPMSEHLKKATVDLW